MRIWPKFTWCGRSPRSVPLLFKFMSSFFPYQAGAIILPTLQTLASICVGFERIYCFPGRAKSAEDQLKSGGLFCQQYTRPPSDPVSAASGQQRKQQIRPKYTPFTQKWAEWHLPGPDICTISECTFTHNIQKDNRVYSHIILLLRTLCSFRRPLWHPVVEFSLRY